MTTLRTRLVTTAAAVVLATTTASAGVATPLGAIPRAMVDSAAGHPALTVSAAAGMAPPSSDQPTADSVAPEDFAALQYRDMLGRRADESGRAYWADRLAQGLDRADLVESFIDSTEVGGAYGPLIRLYRAAFLRPPDRDGLAYWVRVSRSGTDMDRIASWFVASQEFKNRYDELDDAEFVDLVYRNVLGRRADTAGSAYWTARLQAGLTRGGLLRSFAGSAENISRTSVSSRMSLLSVTMLDRMPTRADITAWDAETPEVSTDALIRRVLSSAEYQQRLARLFPDRHRLTGQATTAAPTRPALAVKIDNVDQARPQTALNQADVVYEEMVEANLTRLIAVFHSRVPTVVGPVRSVRVSDFDVLAPYNRPLLAASGANPGVLEALKSAPVINVNALVSPHYWRDTSRRAPHNLYTSPPKLLAGASEAAGTPPSMFITGTPRPGTPTSGADIEFGRASVAWRWNAAVGRWHRSQNGSAHLDAAGAPLAADNLVIMTVEYTPNAIDANSPEAHTVGRGPAQVLVDGSVVNGFWQRSAASDPVRFVDAAGKTIVLRPGRTWIELAPPGSSRILG